VALRALALAARELGDLPLAETHLCEAVQEGEGLARRVAQARMSLVSVRTELGDPAGALRLADQAEDDLAGEDLAALGVQRAIALVRLGRHQEAITHCGLALARAGAGEGRDVRLLVAALLNRGLARTYLEEYQAGAEDLTECLRVARVAGLDHVSALAEANLSFNAARRGDIPTAFTIFRSAEKALVGYPERLAALRTDFAEALIAARLPGEARALLDRAVPELAAAGAVVHLAEARLLLAQVELLADDPRRALMTAQAARDDLSAQGRHGWVPLADDVAVRARRALEPPTPGLLADVLACGGDLDAHGWATAATALRLTAAQLALDLGDHPAARAQLDRVIARSTRTIIRRHAVAIRRKLGGDHRGALAAARAGLAGLGSVDGPADVRAHAARCGEELAAFGLDLALRTGRGATVLSWAERWRAAVRSEPLAGFGVGRLCAALGDGILIELVRRGDDLAAVVVTRQGCVLRRLGSYRAAAEATVRLRYVLRRTGLRDTGRPAAADEEAKVLGDLLLGPLARDPADGPVVIVPTGALHTLPWPVLPALRGRPVSIAPSAASWLAARESSGPGSSVVGDLVVAVAGPGLEFAAGEAGMVTRLHSGAVEVPARVADVLAVLEKADAVHIAAHGVFCPRSPLLSSITLEDGPLMAYDLLRLGRAPRLVVLSACDAGMAHTPADGAPLGLAGTFLDRGSACVVAGLVPVRDDEALTLMSVFHRLLADGHGPAEALAAATETTGVAGFACLGAG
jgi:tetratricopeptide (TPR) repeat protein